MSYSLERKLIETAYKTGMPEAAAIEFANTDFVAPAAGYTRITVLSGGGSKLLGCGALAPRRYAGLVDIAIFVPKNTGTAGLREIADQVEAALAHKSLSEGSVRVSTFGSDFRDLGAAGDWWHGNVSIRFERDKYE